MREQIFKTRLTDMLGIRHPILCGGMGPGVSDGRYIAAVVNAGCMGFIVSSAVSEPGWFEAQLKVCRELVGEKGFGANLYISRLTGGVERVMGLIPLLTKYGVTCVETAGANPEAILPALRDAGILVLHKVPAVKYAKTAARLGVDGVIVVGADCGGHPGTLMISTMVQAPHAAADIKLPIIVGGGIGTGSQLAACLAMGADGIIMGTRMLVAEELWIARAYKDRVVKSDGSESVVVKKLLRDHHRVLDNDSAKAVLELEERKVTDFEAYRPFVMGTLARDAYKTGDPSRGMLDYGPAAVFADEVKPVAAIIDDMLDGAVAASQRLTGLLRSSV